MAIPTITLSVAWGIDKKPRFNTLVQETTGLQGSCYVAGAMSPVWDMVLSVPLLTGRPDNPTSTIAQFLGLYCLARGRAGTFYLPDPWDNTVTNYAFATGDGTSKTFQITRPLGAFSEVVQNINGVPAIYLDGVVNTLNTIDDFGAITFNTAPTLGAVISWSGQFIYLWRFKTDSLNDIKQYFEGFWSISSLELESVNR